MMYGTPLFVASLFALGCGSVSARSDAQPPADAARDTAAAACDVTKPFAPAVEVPGLHDPAATDVHATLTDDELTVYFRSNRFDTTKATMHIYVATRAT